MINAILILDDLRKKYEADSVKVYLEDNNNFTVKIIKGGKVIKAMRSRKDNK